VGRPEASASTRLVLPNPTAVLVNPSRLNVKELTTAEVKVSAFGPANAF